MMKTCSKCAQPKPLTAFYKHPLAVDGHRGDCKVCVLAARRVRYEDDGETLRERVRAYQSANPEKIIEYSDKYRKSERYRRMSRAYSRAVYLRETYGITTDEFDQMLDSQGGRCAVCRSDDAGKTWTVDHDHIDGSIRGILCWHCNVGLGHFRDDIPNLIAAADYLIRSRSIAK